MNSEVEGGRKEIIDLRVGKVLKKEIKKGRAERLLMMVRDPHGLATPS